MGKRLIELRDVSKEYDGDLALDHVNLYINDGEFLTLLGPSGCGKTTMLRLIAGFIMPTTGQILMNGTDIAKVPPYKREINTVFQKYALFPISTCSTTSPSAFGSRRPPRIRSRRRWRPC